MAESKITIELSKYEYCLLCTAIQDAKYYAFSRCLSGFLNEYEDLEKVIKNEKM